MRYHCRSATSPPLSSSREVMISCEPLLTGLDVGEVGVEAVGVVLEEEVRVVLHGHRGDACVPNRLPCARRDEDLRELECAAERHKRHPVESLARAVRVVLVCEVHGELGCGALGEEVARQARAWSPWGRGGARRPHR
jgi:hypothetical protein